MSWIFWIALATVLYAYAGFPLLLWLRARLFPRPIAAGDLTPTLSVVIAAYNEAADIGRRIENLLSQDYPGDRMEIVIASDGSSDATHEIVERYADRNVVLLKLPRQGKCSTLNAGVQAAQGDILVFSDANTHFDRDTVRQLVRPLADAQVGGVAGNQVYLRGERAGSTGDGERLYWNFDQWMKSLQSRAGSVTSATGAIYAIRRALYQTVPIDATDDFFISTAVVAKGYRLVYAPDAKAFEPVAEADGLEFSRKLRIITQGLRAVLYRRDLLNPTRYGFYACQFFTHKVLRRIVGLPILIIAIVCPLLWRDGWVYQVMTICELALLALFAASIALRGTRLGRFKPLAAAWFFLMVNTAAVISLLAVLRGRRVRHWEPERHSAPAPTPALETLEGGSS